MTWGSRLDLKVGDRAKWFGEGAGRPAGATWNPPPPGWKPPTPEEREWSRKFLRNMHVVILEISPSGEPRLARSDDGFEFDPSMDLWCLVDAKHPGWEHPDPKRWKRGFR